jgi:hypothetical protein
MMKISRQAAMFLGVIAFGLLWSGDFSSSFVGQFVSTAEAVRGAPATPMSYAGVARRSVRTPALGWGTAVGVGGPVGIGR